MNQKVGLVQRQRLLPAEDEVQVGVGSHGAVRGGFHVKAGGESAVQIRDRQEKYYYIEEGSFGSVD